MQKLQQTRSGFAMITAIFFMVIIATLLSFMLSTTAETANRTTNSYLNEQAQLLAKSAVEYAILAVSGRDRSGASGCLEVINTQYSPDGSAMFDINLTIRYIGFDSLAGCTAYVGEIQTAESNGTMMIDVYVSDNAGMNLNEPISYHRRTLQKL